LSALTLVSTSANRPLVALPFFIRRFFRLAPMFYLGAAFYLLQNGTGPSVNAPQGIGVRQVVLTLAFLHGWMFDSINSVVPGGWSIADEAMFYLMFPLLLLSLKNGRRTAAALVAGIIVSRLSFTMIPKWFAGYTTPELVQIFAGFCFPTQFPAFIAGFAVYFIIRWLESHPAHALKGKAASAALVVVAVLLVGCAVSANKTLGNYLLADMLFIGLVTAVYLTQSKILVNGVMRHVGLVSYSIYIVHFALIHLCMLYVLPTMQGLAPSVQLWAVYGGVMLLATGISTLTYRCIELPMIGIGRRLSDQCRTIALS
jgi:peptidoglycan/LPS O-acetylase OafA/YrhL